MKETVMTSCNIDDITSVEVDPLLPLYCIIVSNMVSLIYSCTIYKANIAGKCLDIMFKVTKLSN